MRWQLLLLGLAIALTEVVCCAVEINTAPKASDVYDHYRLPTSVKPLKYILRIVTYLDDPKNLSFVGDVAMHLRIVEDTNNITLHAQNLTIDESKITLKRLNGNGQEICVLSTEVNAHHDYYVMQLCEVLRQGEEYMLMMPFEAPLNPALHGYYKSSYRDKATNETRWLSITQFEPAHARAAFPCFDEPEYKAVFTVILGHPQKYKALSNMPLKEAKSMSNKPDWVWSEFIESVPMSTYLVAYSINDFEFVGGESNLQNKVEFRTWARRDAIGQCGYAGKVGPKVLKYYEDVFQIKFPLEKIDQIAIPDFSAGAMENWGLVTYRETALLYADNISSFANQKRVASVIAHELAHQWFGNLVTMRWWTDLWLNEGFATYVASLGVHHISPEWEFLQEESVDNIMSIFKVDALKSSHPISQPIKHTNEISEIFDSISYKKGSTVLRMMHLFLADEAFRSGIHRYLSQHAYGNAEQDNLWSALTETAHRSGAIPRNYDIKTIMDSWTLQTGYPIITVTRDYDQGTAKVEQMRYLLDPAASRTEDNNCWWVPLSYTTQAESNFSLTYAREWMECSEDRKGQALTKTLEKMPGRSEWIIFNVQLSSLYKVNYDDHNWNMLIDTLMSDQFEQIHIVNRAQLIDDALTLAWSGDKDYDVAMRLIEYLVREREYIPWKSALDNLNSVHKILRPTPEYEFFKKYMQKILTPIYMDLHGLNATEGSMESTAANNNAIQLKVLIGGWACRFKVDDCVPRAMQYFQAWRNVPNPDENNPIPTDLRSVVYCTSVRHGDDDDWEFLWTRYKNSNVAAEQKRIISALGCTREIWLLQRYLEWAFDGTSQIRKQDAFYAFGAVAHGEVGYHLAKDYFLTNIKFLHEFYQPNGNELAHLISPLAGQMSTKHDYDVMKAFTEEHRPLLQKVEQSVRRSLETIRVNAQWRERNFNEISRRLRSRTMGE